jgi:hypothetical protein
LNGKNTFDYYTDLKRTGNSNVGSIAAGYICYYAAAENESAFTAVGGDTFRTAEGSGFGECKDSFYGFISVIRISESNGNCNQNGDSEETTPGRYT